MGVVRQNYRITYLDRTTPSLTLPLQGGDISHLHESPFMRSPWGTFLLAPPTCIEGRIVCAPLLTLLRMGALYGWLDLQGK
jgi:hypothetical protein